MELAAAIPEQIMVASTGVEATGLTDVNALKKRSTNSCY